MDQATNLLGAMALAISEKITDEMYEEVRRSGESAAAVIFLGYAPGLSVEVLRQILHLSHPGTVRLIDRLEGDGVVERYTTQDARAVALHLTPEGQELRNRLMRRRLITLESSLGGLTQDERTIFSVLMGKVLANLPKTELDKHHMCRLCCVKTCSKACPIPGNAPLLEPYRKDGAHAT